MAVRASILPNESIYDTKYSIQIGRFTDTHDGTKFFVSLNQEEVEYLMSILPEFCEKIRRSPVCDFPSLSEGRTFTQSRALALAANFYSNSRYFVLQQFNGEKERSVAIRINILDGVTEHLRYAAQVAKFYCCVEEQVTNVKEIIDYILQLIVKEKIENDKDKPYNYEVIKTKHEMTGYPIPFLVAIENLTNGPDYKHKIDQVLTALGCEFVSKTLTFDYFSKLNNYECVGNVSDTFLAKLVYEVYYGCN